MRQELVVFFVILLGSTSVSAKNGSFSRSKRNIIFPSGSGMGIYLALALPLDLPQYEISMSFNYEANYVLPTNVTEVVLGPQYTEVRKARAVTRKSAYSYLENHLADQGYLGKPCLLRTICETAASPIFGHNGLIGDLIHILFTPSTSTAEDIAEDYKMAEEAGFKGKKTCAELYEQCPIDLYELFSVWLSYFGTIIHLTKNNYGMKWNNLFHCIRVLVGFCIFIMYWSLKSRFVRVY